MFSSICVLGSTGSIGQQTLAVCRTYGIRVTDLAGGYQLSRIQEQVLEWVPRRVTMADQTQLPALKAFIQAHHLPTEVVEDQQDPVSLLARTTEAELVMCAIVGLAGLASCLAALENRKPIALANKEALVTGGHLVKQLAAEKGCSIFPVDSEHSAIWQCLQAGSPKEWHKLWLTASGGPFRQKSQADLKQVTVEDALAHPTWQMGRKISIDSATLMNKGLELIEACHLFDTTPDHIDLVIHPQSLIHSMVEWQDGSVLAQLSQPDMTLPIQIALAGGAHVDCSNRRFNPFTSGGMKLAFEAIPEHLSKAPNLAKRAFQENVVAPIVLNAANEVAVEAFLTRQISFLSILSIVEAALEKDFGSSASAMDFDGVCNIDARVRSWVKETMIGKRKDCP